jgi:outer membrane protein
MSALRKLSWIVIALAAMGLLPAGGVAQQAMDTLTLTLEDALRIAEGANPTYRQSENSLGLNGAEARSTWFGSIAPRLNLDLYGTAYNGRLTRRAFDNLGRPIENPDADWIYDSNTIQTFSLSWNIQGASLFNAKKLLNQSQRGRELGVSAARATLRSEVARLFYDALEQGSLLEVEESLAEARATDLESARRLFELARSTRVDVLNAEVQVDQQAINIQQQRRRHEQALLLLRTTLGDAGLPPLRLEASELPVFDPSALDEEALLARARRESPLVRRAESDVDGARYSLDDAGAWKWPTLSVQYNLSRYVQTSEAASVFDVGFDTDDLQSNFRIGVSVPFLNNFFQNRYQEAQASVELANRREELRRTRLDVDQSVRSELINLRNQYESMRLATRSRDIAGQATALAREEYRLGARTFEQLQETVRQEADARRQVIQARFAFVDALIALESAVGGPVAASAGGAG